MGRIHRFSSGFGKYTPLHFKKQHRRKYGTSTKWRRLGKYFSPDKIIVDEFGYQFYKDLNGKKLLAVLKVLSRENEIFVQSFRLVSDKQWRKAFKE
ncbi:TPA: hypothetical protein ACPP6G_001654 [Haemophilus influenzae]